MIVQTLEDLIGDGSAHQITATLTQGKFVSIRAGASNSGVVRFGDSTISNSRGGTLAAGQWYDFPPIAEIAERYSLNQIYYLAALNDTVQVVFGA